MVSSAAEGGLVTQTQTYLVICTCFFLRRLSISFRSPPLLLQLLWRPVTFAPCLLVVGVRRVENIEVVSFTDGPKASLPVGASFPASPYRTMPARRRIGEVCRVEQTIPTPIYERQGKVKNQRHALGCVAAFVDVLIVALRFQRLDTSPAFNRSW
jgi:hypothetical protein